MSGFEVDAVSGIMKRDLLDTFSMFRQEYSNDPEILITQPKFKLPRMTRIYRGYSYVQHSYIQVLLDLDMALSIKALLTNSRGHSYPTCEIPVLLLTKSLRSSANIT